MKEKKQRMVLFVLILIMTALTIIYLILIKVQKEAGLPTSGEETIELYTLDTQKATKLEVESSDVKMILGKESGTWYLEDEKEFPLDQSKVTIMLNQLENVSATHLIATDPDDMEQYGLNEPSLMIYVELENGVSTKINLGNEVPIQGGYYATVDEGTTVYTMNTITPGNFLKERSEWMAIEEIPAMGAERITYLSIEGGVGNFTAAKERLEIRTEETGLFTIGAPYSDVKGNSTVISELYQNIQNLSYLKCIDYNCEDASEYGITNDAVKFDLQYEDGNEKDKTLQEFILWVGKADGNGNYYVRPDGSNFVYLMEEGLLENILLFDAFACVDPYLYTAEESELVKLEVKQGKKTAIYIIKPKQGKNQDKKEVAQYNVTRDNKEFDYEIVAKALRSLETLNYKAKIQEEKIKGEKEIASLIIHTTDGKQEIRFLEYDRKNYYRVNMDGKEYFLVDMKEVKEIMDQFL